MSSINQDHLTDHIAHLALDGITSNSRDVKQNYLFAALPGSKRNGCDFIPDAIKAGATAILASTGSTKPETFAGAWIESDLIRKDFAKIAAQFYGPAPQNLVAVTGTNGKTSVAHFTRQLWSSQGINAASLGTTGLYSASLKIEDSLTTPDPVTLHTLLKDLHTHNVTHVAMEASSHGLDQYRLDGTSLKTAGFTNLSQDHLDYHGTMDDYFKAKARLFSEVLDRGKEAVINTDDPFGFQILNICQERRHTLKTYGRKNADLMIIEHHMQHDGQHIVLDIHGKRVETDLKLVGDFQAMNLLCALGMSGLDVEDNTVAHRLANVTSVEGRMDYAGSYNGAGIYVDYAHTPDALKTALKALRPHVQNRLIVIFGAGGDRDTEKRPMMGRAVESYADIGIVTDDNPRSENPQTIRHDVMQGCPIKGVDGADRLNAFQMSLDMLQKGDVLLIAGKGHESGQTIGSQTLPFHDKTEIQKLIEPHKHNDKQEKDHERNIA